MRIRWNWHVFVPLKGKPVHFPLSHTPPFVSVHHNATLKSLVGGLAGNTIVPGAMTQAHHGVLLLMKHLSVNVR